jgi:hypothetical protein
MTVRTGQPLPVTLERLSEASVHRHFDAYQDVAWADVGEVLDPTDPRWRLSAHDPLAATDWYRELPEAEAAAIGLERTVGMLKVGWQFENILQRGLLRRGLRLDDADPALRYIHHEIAEESQHTLMFQEFVRRAPVPADGMPRPLLATGERMVVRMAQTFPALFFVFVMGGEDPADHVQRRLLRDEQAHPLLRDIMRIHVAEEARHLSFARAFLTEAAPRLPARQRHVLALRAPMILALMARQMLHPSRAFVARHSVPRPVLAASYGSPAGRALLRDALARPRELLRELDLVTPAARPIWMANHIWAD